MESASREKNNGTAEPNETILLVDDEHFMRRFTSFLLRTTGYTVIEARSFFGASKNFLKYRSEIDLVVIGLRMSGSSGTQLVDHMLKVDPEVRVMFITSGQEPLPERPQKLFLGVEKPFSPDILLKTVRHCLATCQ